MSKIIKMSKNIATILKNLILFYINNTKIMNKNINNHQSNSLNIELSILEKIKKSFSLKAFLVIVWSSIPTKTIEINNSNLFVELWKANIDIPCNKDDTKLLYFRQIHWSWYEEDSFDLEILNTIKYNQEFIYKILSNLSINSNLKISTEWVTPLILQNYSYEEFYKYAIKRSVTWYVWIEEIINRVDEISNKLLALTSDNQTKTSDLLNLLKEIKILEEEYMKVKYLKSLEQEYAIVWWAAIKLASEWLVDLIPGESDEIVSYVDDILIKQNLSIDEFIVKYPNIVFDLREDSALDMIHKYWDKNSTNAIVYWWMHDFRDNVEKWNLENPDFKYCLTTISPWNIDDFIQ